MDPNMFNFRVLADLSADFVQRTEEPPRASNESSIYEQSFDLDALERYRESVIAANLTSTYEGPLLVEDEPDKLDEWAVARVNSRCLKQECLSGQQLLQKIRVDQERREKLLELDIADTNRRHRWEEFDIRINSELNYIKERDIAKKTEVITQLAENEKEYRRRLRLPYFVDLFFEIEEKLFPELSEIALELVNRVWNNFAPDDEVFSEDFNVKVRRHDLKTLQGLNWLNDEVINFYLNLIVRRSEQRRDLPKTYAFNTFFLSTLGSRGYKGVQRWTRKVDIFSYDVILIPVHLGNHWCLAAIDMKAREINYYDSLGGTNIGCLETLKNYLVEEHQDKKKAPINLSGWSMKCREDVPRQMNGSDCGVFTSCFAEFSSRRCDPKFDQRIMPYYRKRMVYEICRKELMI